MHLYRINTGISIIYLIAVISGINFVLCNMSVIGIKCDLYVSIIITFNYIYIIFKTNNKYFWWLLCVNECIKCTIVLNRLSKVNLQVVPTLISRPGNNRLVFLLSKILLSTLINQYIQLILSCSIYAWAA